MGIVLRVILLVICVLLTYQVLPDSHCAAHSFRVMLPLPNGESLPAYCFLPHYGIRPPLPGVVYCAGVGSTKVIQHHTHCQRIANKGKAGSPSGQVY